MKSKRLWTALMYTFGAIGAIVGAAVFVSGFLMLAGALGPSPDASFTELLSWTAEYIRVAVMATMAALLFGGVALGASPIADRTSPSHR